MFSFDKVDSVYSGKRNSCCCGCKGKHSYRASSTQASKEWGTVNDRVVDQMVKKVKTQVECFSPYEPAHEFASEDCMSVDVGNRTYVCYMR